MTALWWIKQDFRLADNPALTAALAEASSVVPVFLFEPRLLAAEETGPLHVAAWCEALGDLRQRLAAVGADVLVLEGDAPDAFERLRQRVPFDAIWSHEEIGTALTYARDRSVRAWADAAGVAWHEVMQVGVFRGGIDRDTRGRAWNAFMRAGPLPPPEAGDLARLAVPPEAQPLATDTPLTPETFSHPLTDAQREHRQRVSETAAEETLQGFLTDRGICYSGGISSPNTAFVCGSR
ncbi:MAG: deoxyribodipyrimidine photo-lyase, partial [Bacteroidota bacterium]